MFQIVKDRGKWRDLRRERSDGSVAFKFMHGFASSANIHIARSQG
jgi:hypothetical protein